MIPTTQPMHYAVYEVPSKTVGDEGTETILRPVVGWDNRFPLVLSDGRGCLVFAFNLEGFVEVREASQVVFGLQQDLNGLRTALAETQEALEASRKLNYAVGTSRYLLSAVPDLLEQAEIALIDLHACADEGCGEENCSHILFQIRQHFKMRAEAKALWEGID